MIDQAKRDEWAELLTALATWPTYWVPTFDNDDQWAGKWVGVGADGNPVVFDGSEDDRRVELAVLIASLVTCVPDMLGHIARLESLYTVASSTADSLEAIGEAQIERARRHNAEVQAVVDGARMRHEEDGARLREVESLSAQRVGRITELDNEREAWAGAARRVKAAADDRIRALEAGLREADEYVRCLLDEGDDSSPVAIRMAALRKLAGEP